jgi:ATP-binding cassette, subfamily B, bacterial MsbA
MKSAADAAAAGRSFPGAGVARCLALGLKAVRRHPGLGAVFVVATLTQGALQGLLVWALREVLQRFSLPDAHTARALVLASVGVLALWVLRAYTAYVGEIVSVRLAQRAETDSMREVLAKLLSMSVRFIDRSSQGDLVMAAYKDHNGIRMVTLQLGTVLLSVARLLGLAIVAWMMSPRLAFLGLITVPLGAIPAYWLGRRITVAARAERRSAATMQDSFLQVAAGFRVIKVNRAESRVLDRFFVVSHDIYRSIVRQAQSASLSRFLLEAVSGFGLIAVLIVGGRDVAEGRLGWQSLLSLLVAVMAIYSPILNLMTVYSSIRSSLPSIDRLDALLAIKPDIPMVHGPRHIQGPPATIELRDLTFAYDDQIVLDSISATFRRGETIGIVGPSGAGKSTLISLLLRLYDPTHGRILYDGVDVRELRHSELLDQCAIVLQEPFLFVDTIANNIRFTRPDASMDDVIAAAKAANIHDEIMLTERGYETLLGRHEQGRGISVGQKQRICIAAALLKNAPILFLDEATSNLDSVSERAVQGAIEALVSGRTSFVIAHRMSTLRSVDRIMVLEEGRLVGLGTHRELLQICPLYHRLWHSQVERPELETIPPPALRALP